MSDTPSSERPSDDSPDFGSDQPPYPGWSTRQPPPSGWTAPGQPGPPAGRPEGAPPPGPTPPPAAVPPQQAGWTQQAQPGWGTGTGWGWQPPTVKPGVIPLRPLGVGEILDGAVTTIRRNPGPMLGLSAVVAVATQLLGLGASWLLLRDFADVELSTDPSASEVFDAFAGAFGATAVVVVVTWIATVLLTGILTVVVSRAVLGEQLSASEAWRAARRRLPKLLLLTLLYSVIWLAPLLSALVVAVAIGAASGDGALAGGLGALLALAAIPVAIWLYVRYALSGPSLMLESTSTGGAPPKPVGVAGALRRSAELVRGSWWRVFGILLLVLLIVIIISQVINVPFVYLPSFFIGDEVSDTEFLVTLVIGALGGIVGATLTAPFTAAATALLYVDRRIRREGLDIELARAAGVSIPGGTAGGPEAPRSP